MATSPRYYLLAEDGTIHRLARSTFYDLILQEVAVFPELSGQRVRLATIHVRLDGRRPVSVASATFNYMTFRDDGVPRSLRKGKLQIHLVETGQCCEESMLYLN